MTDTGSQYDTEWRDCHTVLDQESTNYGQAHSGHDLAIDTTPPYIIDLLTQMPSEGNSDQFIYCSSLPNSPMTTQDQSGFSRPTMSRGADSFTDRFPNAAPLNGTNTFPGDYNDTFQIDPSLWGGSFGTEQPRQSLAWFQSEPSITIDMSIDHDDPQPSLASTGDSVTRAFGDLAYPIATGPGHHDSMEIAGHVLPLPAQPLLSSPGIHAKELSRRPLPPGINIQPQQPSIEPSLRETVIQSDRIAVGKRKRHTRSEMTGERLKRSLHMTPAGSQSSEYCLESRASIVSTKQTTPLSDVSIHQDATDLTRQELASSKGVDCHGTNMTCDGKIGICLPEQFQSARPFNKDELLMAEFLSQAVSGKSLGWHIYWITPASFTMKVLAKSSGFPESHTMSGCNYINSLCTLVGTIVTYTTTMFVL
jgi:hypothetical protein